MQVKTARRGSFFSRRTALRIYYAVTRKEEDVRQEKIGLEKA